MVIPLSNRTGAPVKWGQSAKTQKVGKRTAESAMTDGFVEQIKKHAKEVSICRRNLTKCGLLT